MSHNERIALVVAIVFILLGISHISRSVALLRDEVEEFRQYMMGEKREDPDGY